MAKFKVGDLIKITNPLLSHHKKGERVYPEDWVWEIKSLYDPETHQGVQWYHCQHVDDISIFGRAEIEEEWVEYA